MKYIRENCIPEGITASYNALTSLINKYVLTKPEFQEVDEVKEEIKEVKEEVKEEDETQDSN